MLSDAILRIKRQEDVTVITQAYNNRNLKYFIPDYIPTEFHNLSGNDTNLFLKEFEKKIIRDNV